MARPPKPAPPPLPDPHPDHRFPTWGLVVLTLFAMLAGGVFFSVLFGVDTVPIVVGAVLGGVFTLVVGLWKH